MCEGQVMGIDLGANHITCVRFDPAAGRLWAKQTMLIPPDIARGPIGLRQERTLS